MPESLYAQQQPAKYSGVLTIHGTPHLQRTEQFVNSRLKAIVSISFLFMHCTGLLSPCTAFVSVNSLFEGNRSIATFVRKAAACCCQ